MAPRHREPVLPATIRWHEVIELDPRMPAGDRAALINALELLEHSKIGQDKFAEAREIQAMTPKNAHKLPIILRDSAGSPELERTIKEIEDAFKPFMDARTQAPKTFIASLQESDRHTLLFQQLISKGGASAKPNNFILLHLPTLANAQVYKVEPDGGLRLHHVPLSEAIIHEFQHQIDNQRSLWITNQRQMTIPCKEERAIVTENLLLAEKFPGQPLRGAYSNPEAQFHQLLATLKQAREASMSGWDRALRALGLYKEQPLLEPNELLQYAKGIKNGVMADAGCKGIANDEALAKTRQILLRAGIASEQLGFLPPPLAAPAARSASGDDARKAKSH